MPLIIMCGIPGSGKTTRAKQIAEYLTTKYKQNVVIVNEESLKINKKQAYESSHEEKMTRGKIKFQTEKALTGNTIVIADSLNYIKGFRYQMFCIARQQKTTYCVVFCRTQLQVAQEFNNKNQQKFPQEMVEDLSKRMQQPHMKSNSLAQHKQIDGMFHYLKEEVKNRLLYKKLHKFYYFKEEKLGEDYLYEMDKKCQEVCDQAVLGKIKLKNNWNALLLKKVKKDFVCMIKENPIALKSVKQSFISYLIESDKRK